ncbi:MAG: NIPSNAP family protein [Planctomycetota bacterium]
MINVFGKKLNATRTLVACVFAIGMLLTMSDSAAAEVVEIRQYILGDNGDASALDDFLGGALIPALERLGVGPVGALYPHPSDENNSKSVFVLIPYADANQVDATRMALQQDNQFLTDGKAYLSRGAQDTPIERIRSELVVGMDCWPKTIVPNASLQNEDRVLELRLYESPNERLGDVKVDMFNNGEVPIFLDCGITPVFIGQALIGPLTPSLTYLTTYPSEADRVEAWKAFRKHPDWQTLKVVPKYSGTVNRIDKFVLSPKPYSQM